MKRKYEPHGTYSETSVIDDALKVVFTCKTLELPWKGNQRKISCIPPEPGNTVVYDVIKMAPTEKRPYVYFHVLNVPDRDSILWHPGNYTSQILGCMLHGEAFKDLNKDGQMDILNTTVTLKKLADILPDRFKLTIHG